MSYLITYVRRKGNAARSVATYDHDEASARAVAESLAALSQRVTLTEMDDDGIPAVLAIWENGTAKRKLPQVSTPDETESVTIEGESSVVLDDTTEPDPEVDAEIANAAAADDSGETYNAYCVKCHEKRDIHGEVTETENGRRRVQGNCPVCGTKVFRFLPSQKAEPDEPEDDGSMTDAEIRESVADEDAARDEAEADPEIAELTEQVTEAISESIPEGTTLPEVAQAVSEAAVEFSDDAAEAAAEPPVPAEKPAPRKRASRKAKAEADPEKPGKAECPQCFRNVDYKVAGSTKLRYIANHPDEKKSGGNCRGSGATVEDSMIRG